MFSVNVDGNVGGQMFCRLGGELDLSAAPAFRRALADVPSGARVLLDMSAVTFVDSAGLGALVGAIRRSRDGGGDAAVCARPGLSRLLRTVGLDRLVTISQDIQSAMGALCDRSLSLPNAV